MYIKQKTWETIQSIKQLMNNFPQKKNFDLFIRSKIDIEWKDYIWLQIQYDKNSDPSKRYYALSPQLNIEKTFSSKKKALEYLIPKIKKYIFKDWTIFKDEIQYNPFELETLPENNPSGEKKTKFQFLSKEEFNKLDDSDKLRYIFKLEEYTKEKSLSLSSELYKPENLDYRKRQVENTYIYRKLRLIFEGIDYQNLWTYLDLKEKPKILKIIKDIKKVKWVSWKDWEDILDSIFSIYIWDKVKDIEIKVQDSYNDEDTEDLVRVINEAIYKAIWLRPIIELEEKDQIKLLNKSNFQYCDKCKSNPCNCESCEQCWSKNISYVRKWDESGYTHKVSHCNDCWYEHTV